MDFFKLIDRANEAHLATMGIAIPQSISRSTAESEDAPLAKLPDNQDEARPSEAVDSGDYDEDAPDEYDETWDWPDDHKLDSPIHVPYANLRRR